MKTYILPILILLCALPLMAQPHHKEKIDALKVAFITEHLDLTKQEAQEFWPIYNEFDKENSKLRHHEMRKIRKEIKDNVNTLSEEKAIELLSKLNDLETRIHKNRLEFAVKIKDMLPAKKIIKLRIAEEDFKRKMLNQWKTRRRGQGNRP